MQEVKYFLDNSAEKMLFIYGEYDPWSSTAVELNTDATNRELYKFVKTGGDHKTRIHSFNSEYQKKIFAIIDRWLKND